MPDDEHQILRTLAEYGQWWDDGRVDEWAVLFTEGARLDVAGRTIEGRQAIRSYMETVQADGGQGVHVTSDVVVDLDVDGAGTATAASSYLFVRPTGSGPVVVAAGRYRDEVVHDGGRWRFRSRTISILSAPRGGADG
ncbi:MAG: nuclear transport factor 2 family protein [Acidimicrobiales bacterium]